MRDTVVTVEPDHLAAELVDGRVSMRIDTGDVRAHLEVPEDGPAVVAIAAEDGGLHVTVELTEADVAALEDGLGRVTRRSD